MSDRRGAGSCVRRLEVLKAGPVLLRRQRQLAGVEVGLSEIVDAAQVVHESLVGLPLRRLVGQAQQVGGVHGDVALVSAEAWRVRASG